MPNIICVYKFFNNSVFGRPQGKNKNICFLRKSIECLGHKIDGNAIRAAPTPNKRLVAQLCPE